MSVIEEKKALRTFIRKKERTLDCLNNFYFRILSNFLGSLHGECLCRFSFLSEPPKFPPPVCSFRQRKIQNRL